MRRYTIAVYDGKGWRWHSAQARGTSRADALRRLGCDVPPRSRVGLKDGRQFTALRAADNLPVT